MAAEDQRPINVADYNFEEGKLVASVRWLITKIYEDNDIPDKLQRLFLRDDERLLHLSPNLVGALVNGSLYSQAASKILQDPSLLTKSVGAVLKALASADIEVRDAEGGMIVEEQLVTENPFKLTIHLTLMDALMTAHMKSIISIERVVQAVSTYTSVDKREEPLDCVDALLFWINKICLLVRDDVERQGIALRGSEEGAEPTIPEMEDLYEDLCDGTCVCSLAAFYRPHEVNLKDIYFNDPISINDCRYNLGILKEFCSTCLPYNPFHFEIEDILYLHESLQPNVNAFLTDLFAFFESDPQPISPVLTSPVQRRFVPIQGIPELRAHNLATRPIHPPKANRNSYGSSQRDRTMSVASADSLMTTRSGDSFRLNQQKPNHLPPGIPTTNFGNLNADAPQLEEPTNTPPNFKAMAEMRLAFEEKRREHEKKLAMNSAMKEEERIKMGKNAFFKLMSKSGHEQTPINEDPPRYEGASTAREMELTAQLEDIREELKNLKVMQQQSMSNLTNVGMSHATSQPSLYNDAYQQQLYGTLPHKSPHHPMPQAVGQPGMPGPMGQPVGPNGMPQMGLNQSFGQPSMGNINQNLPPYYQSPEANRNSSFGMQQQFAPSPYGGYHMDPSQHYAMPNNIAPHMNNMPNSPYYQPPPQYPQPGFQLHQSNSQGALHMASQYQSPYQQQQAYYNQSPHPSMSYSMYEQNGAIISPQEEHYASPQIPNPNTFRLHQPFASSSRLDPPLELNRNLTNWGMTYREERTPRRQWANVSQEEERKNENGNQGDNAESIPQPPAPAEKNPTPPRDPHRSSEEISQQRDPSPEKPVIPHNNNNKSDVTPRTEVKRANSGLVIADVGANGGSEWTAEMEARRQALLMNQMRRKEQSKVATEDKKSEIDVKIREEQRRKDLAEQRKLDREIKRQQVLEEYKRKKAEQEIQELSGSVSARSSTGSVGTISRGHSQPPFGRPKSQSNMSTLQMRTMQRQGRAQSSVTDENSLPKITVPALADPTLKLYAKAQPKSNRSLIMNALQYSVFPGAVSNDQRNKVQAALAQSDSKHFLVLFRDHKCQYRGLYTWNQQDDTVHRIEGMGPKICKEEMMHMMFKYDSGAKHFNHIPTKSLSATIDGFTIQDQYWQKAKIPHSRAV
ncbi:unnamed protein product [Bursaphelenchus xylophilus]|uniref:(pine wood nematode) hypothetical protein n=1 Tax=Bursaphelenchus xylophilus TaxID=6326 RepID=A0A1I7SL78_BURXY|nr:unnamed protein product [Bursaphelenchus xylophilus]CAG9129398.1 unnamed protein product [Bursaphelenchus xylophilus]